MSSVSLFFLLSLMSCTILSLPVPEINGTLSITSVSEDIEKVNRNIGLLKGGPTIQYGDIAINTNKNADPCTATGCKWPKTGSFVYVPVVISAGYYTAFTLNPETHYDLDTVVAGERYLGLFVPHSEHFTSAEQSVIIQALVSFHDVTCIRFVWRTTQTDFLYFYPGTGCWSYVGRQPGGQLVSLQKYGCVYFRTAQHEVLHALGFHHEQVRSDRDNYVTILQSNILPANLINFRKVQTNNLATAYDYNSVMHYGRYEFSKSPGVLPTIVPKPNPNQAVGEALRMSPNDIARVNRLYQCTGY